MRAVLKNRILLGTGLILAVSAGFGPRSARAEQRVYSIAVNPQSDDYTSAFNLAVEAGVRGQTIAWRWSDLEPSPGTFRLNEAADNIQLFCKEQNFTVLVTLMVLDGPLRQTPSDLAEILFDSDQMKSRFHALVDSVAPLMDSHVRYVAVGSEVDLYLSKHPEQWEPYERFYQDAVDYIHQKMPDVKVGVCATYPGAVGPDAQKISSLNKHSDVWVTTYYPVDDNFRPAGPTAAISALPSMVEAAAGLPVVIQEIGYPSSVLIAGSEQDQAEFISNTFDAWAMEGDKIPFLSFWLMYDTPQAELEEETVQRKPAEPARFKAFRGSLGLRRSDGTPKPAWSALIEKAKQAGFLG